jgi:prepilin-type N-terminal cleavage/methylation domain-containing protein
MHRRRAFTLVELLVVIALIGVLAALLLSALSSAQQRARATQTTSTMEAFAAACETFFQDHGQYPGVVPEALLAQDAEANNGIPRISSLENALYHMMGGYRILGVHPDYAQFNGYEMSFGNGNNEITVKFAINSELLGDGPLIGGRQYPSYFTPPEGTLVKAFGQVGDEENLVDVVDAWGQPLALLRRQRTVGVLPNNRSGNDGNPETWQFRTEGAAPYFEAGLSGLGELRKQQAFSNNAATCILSQENTAFFEGNVGRILANPAIREGVGNPNDLYTQPRGSMLLLSAGADGVFFSSQDGPGSEDSPISNIFDATQAAIGEYDDILRFIGS